MFPVCLANGNDSPCTCATPSAAAGTLDKPWLQPRCNAAPVPYFYKTFSIAKKIRSATLYIAAHGLYEASVNGARVGDAYLTPGWTSYKTRLQYQQYDVKALLQKGSNAMKVMVARGWWSGSLKWDRVPDN